MTNHIIAGQDTAIAITRTIRAAMTDRGVTIDALAEETDLPAEELHYWITLGDAATFDLEAVCRVCSALDITLTATQNPHE